MKTEIRLPEQFKATQIERVKFRDGMIVTAEDLEAAMLYPSSMLHIVLRSYFGCGIVCGLDLKPDPKAGGASTFVVCLSKGVAFDCNGYPLELCGPVKLDLSPDACSCEDPPEEVCIAIRRVTSDEAPHDGCSCSTDDPRFQCSRVRDHVMVKAFLPDELVELNSCLCAKPAPVGEDEDCDDDDDVKEDGRDGSDGRGEPSGRPQALPGLCDCLTTCTDCGCCDESWILVGCVRLKQEGIVRVDTSRRQYVKPIDCLCERTDQYEKLHKMVHSLEDKIEQMAQYSKSAVEQEKPGSAKATAAQSATVVKSTPASKKTPATKKAAGTRKARGE